MVKVKEWRVERSNGEGGGRDVTKIHKSERFRFRIRGIEESEEKFKEDLGQRQQPKISTTVVLYFLQEEESSREQSATTDTSIRTVSHYGQDDFKNTQSTKTFFKSLSLTFKINTLVCDSCLFPQQQS
jgi:hypothetical protein